MSVGCAAEGCPNIEMTDQVTASVHGWNRKRKSRLKSMCTQLCKSGENGVYVHLYVQSFMRQSPGEAEIKTLSCETNRSLKTNCSRTLSSPPALIYGGFSVPGGGKAARSGWDPVYNHWSMNAGVFDGVCVCLDALLLQVSGRDSQRYSALHDPEKRVVANGHVAHVHTTQVKWAQTQFTSVRCEILFVIILHFIYLKRVFICIILYLTRFRKVKYNHFNLLTAQLFKNF